ncbi:MAG: hypothetical protein AAFV19_21980 [Pseudomonadota bacterium]
MSRGAKKPLYRRVNTRTHGVHHGHGGDYRNDRNTKKETRNASSRGSMHSHHRHGYDYTPLFRFLLSKVGEDWSAVHSEAVSRLDREDPVYWLIARCAAEERRFVRIGESTYYSGLCIDEDNRLARVDPDLTVDLMSPSCACCTHTFNGVPFTRAYDGIHFPAEGRLPD